MSFTPSLNVFRHRAYAHYWVMRQLLSGARQMQAVAIGWQVYDLARATRPVEEAAFILGMVGLAQFAPVFFLSLVGGQAADRFDRRIILIVSNIVRAMAGLGLIATVYIGADALPMIFLLAVVLGGVNAFTPAASNALYPKLVPRADLPNAIAWNSLGYQSAAIAGPAIGGFLYALGGQVVYAVSTVMVLCAIIAISTAKTPKQERVDDAKGLSMVIEGLRYVRDNKIVLGAISLDLIVVFFGGATALLPVFARDILHIGAGGLGALRAAPAFGAAIIAFLLAVRPLNRKVGRWMLGAIIVYGCGTLVFAWSTAFWLSMAALAVTGAADMISVYIRQSLIQLATPDAMRGRVASVSFIFISASNELGEFESGVAARFLGPIGAVILGGSVAIITALSWTRLFPALARADRLEETPEILAADAERLKVDSDKRSQLNL
ncbi:MAG: MFS transporter [Parvularculaceae bacterium]|nr:MFS transporter [Parvularculaceae bacterium]